MALGTLISVGGVALPTPSKYVYNEADVSAPNAGRTASGLMYKYKMGSNVQIDLGWSGITTAQLKTILTAFASEYFTATYLDPRTGTAPNYTVTREFYVGDRTAPMYNAALDLWENVEFTIIERGVH